MRRQNEQARIEDFTFLRTGSDVIRFVNNGRLVRLHGNANYEVKKISYPYARPAVKTFVERLASQYRAACGEKLVVTSLTRPLSRQPRNAHELSVHPTGMAVDLRRSRRRSCRTWLERTLSQLERSGVLDATRESRPAHYHVAVFPDKYTGYLAQLTGKSQAEVVASANADRMRIAVVDAAPAQASVLPIGIIPTRKSTESYTVRKGDSLWTIARRFGTTVNALKAANQLSSSRLMPGQKLLIPITLPASAEEPEAQ